MTIAVDLDIIKHQTKQTKSVLNVSTTLRKLLLQITPKFTGVISEIYIYSNQKETSDFHGTVSFDPVKMLQQK